MIINKKYILKFILLFIFSGLFTYSQAQTYNLTVDNKPFVFLENPQSAVEGPWDDPEFHVPIGFEFGFFDILSDQLHSFPNSLGGYTSLNQDEEHLYMLIHFFVNLIDIGYQQDSSISKIYYKTEGSMGQRIFTLEYNNAGIFGGLEDENGIFLDYINLQIRLFEGTGDVEYHYGPNSIQENPEIVFDPFTGPVVGLLANADNIQGGFIGEAMLLEGNALDPIVVTDTIAWLDWPIPENTVYRFSRMGTSVGDHLSAVYQPLFFPNPTSGEIHLNGSIANEVIYPITVIDVLGKKVVQWNQESEISASSLTPGSYYLIVRAKDKVVTEKLLVLPD